MATSVHLFLKANGADIKGESTETSLGRADSIECLHYEQTVSSARETTVGTAIGRRQYQPLTFRKRIDKASPLLVKALTNNEAIEATFKFFRPSPSGDGITEQFYTVAIKQGRITAIAQLVRDTLATPDDPALEDVSIAFNNISWTYTNGGISHVDNIGVRGAEARSVGTKKRAKGKR